MFCGLSFIDWSVYDNMYNYNYRIFGRTLSLILENIENYLLNCNDIVGLLIMIKVRNTMLCFHSCTKKLMTQSSSHFLFTLHFAIPHTQQMTHLLRMVMQRRRIPVLDSLFDRISLLLWPRFKQVFDANLKSIRSANAKKLGPVDVSPHYVSRLVAIKLYRIS